MIQMHSCLERFFVLKASSDIDNKTKTQEMMNFKGLSKTCTALYCQLDEMRWFSDFVDIKVAI